MLRKQNFISVNVDNSTLIQELHHIEPFVFVSNPGNCGDLIILKATIDFFNSNNIKYKFWDGKSNPKNLVYCGGGIWIPNYKNVWLSRNLPLFIHANRILILPSSFYSCPELVNILDDRFIIFCREKQSYNYMKKRSNK